MKRSVYEGLQKRVRALKAPAIDVWENKYSDKEYTVTIDIPEFTCVCPHTGLPDFAHITIRYSPQKWCVELKSFKLYTIYYRDVGIFNEHVVNKILEDFVRACSPRWAEIVGEFNARGGIRTTVRAEYKSENKPI
jgi:7-cyano-7-deazaguanine reductase